MGLAACLLGELVACQLGEQPAYLPAALPACPSVDLTLYLPAALEAFLLDDLSPDRAAHPAPPGLRGKYDSNWSLGQIFLLLEQETVQPCWWPLHGMQTGSWLSGWPALERPIRPSAGPGVHQLVPVLPGRPSRSPAGECVQLLAGRSSPLPAGWFGRIQQMQSEGFDRTAVLVLPDNKRSYILTDGNFQHLFQFILACKNFKANSFLCSFTG